MTNDNKPAAPKNEWVRPQVSRIAAGSAEADGAESALRCTRQPSVPRERQGVRKVRALARFLSGIAIVPPVSLRNQTNCAEFPLVVVTC